MKRYDRLAPVVCVVALAVGLSGAFFSKAAYSKIVTNVPPDISSEELKAVVIEDFENASSQWIVETTPKKFKGAEGGDEKKRAKDPVPVLEIKVLEGAPSDMLPEQWTPDKKGMEKKNCLGVHFKFRYPGYNSVHIIPPAVGNPAVSGINMPGRAKWLSLWVHGRGQEYTLEAWVQDYKGNVHILKFGSLNYVGWRPLKVEIPGYIPQDVNSYPAIKSLKLVRLVLRSSPNEGTEECFYFFDQIKILTGVYEANYDGQQLDRAFKGGQEQPAVRPGTQPQQ